MIYLVVFLLVILYQIIVIVPTDIYIYIYFLLPQLPSRDTSAALGEGATKTMPQMNLLQAQILSNLMLKSSAIDSGNVLNDHPEKHNIPQGPNSSLPPLTNVSQPNSLQEISLFSCPLCQFQTPGKDLFTIHMLLHKSIMERTFQTNNNQNSGDPRTPNFNGTLRSNLHSANNNAMKVDHDNLTFNFACPICKINLPDQTQLEEHVMAHNTRPYQCDKCSQKFMSSEDRRVSLFFSYASHCLK